MSFQSSRSGCSTSRPEGTHAGGSTAIFAHADTQRRDATVIDAAGNKPKRIEEFVGTGEHRSGPRQRRAGW